MSILNDKQKLEKALEKAHKKYPIFQRMYPVSKEKCCHNYSFVVYCDENYDIRRCTKCGDEQVFNCNFNTEETEMQEI